MKDENMANSRTIDADLYCTQYYLPDSAKNSQKRIFLAQGNAASHTARCTKENIKGLDAINLLLSGYVAAISTIWARTMIKIYN